MVNVKPGNIRFGSPPVSEVVFSLGFEPVPLPLTRYGDLATRLRPTYPLVQDTLSAQPLRFISADEAQILQVEPGRLTANWRRRQRDSSYPGHSELHERFALDLGEFNSFLSDIQLNAIRPQTLILGYLNQVSLEGEPYTDLLFRLFPDIQWRRDESRKLPHPAGVNWQTVFVPDQSGMLVVILKAPALATEGPWKGSSVIQFDFFAQGEAAGETSTLEVLDWFSGAHQWILNAFQELTSDEFRFKHWKQMTEGV